MTVHSCANCGAPKSPHAARCDYCGAHFVDAPSASSGIDRDIEEMIRKGNLIGAVKIYRERHASSLRDAKDAVEALQKRLKI